MFSQFNLFSKRPVPEVEVEVKPKPKPKARAAAANNALQVRESFTKSEEEDVRKFARKQVLRADALADALVKIAAGVKDPAEFAQKALLQFQ